jgi:acrylyl-CoA reductase (NADPH) / 3-hydroxypropionyl-CoA dehydratase / 3-hydroxypropionyl-CoA synthetase
MQTKPDAPRLINPVGSRIDWERMRGEVLADPGAFHGAQAAASLHWFVPKQGAGGAWLQRSEDGIWRGWDALTGEACTAPLPSDFTPWNCAFDASDAPHWKWFSDLVTVPKPP